MLVKRHSILPSHNTMPSGASAQDVEPQKHTRGLFAQKSRLLATCLAAVLFLSVTAMAQKPVARITRPIDDSQRVPIPNSHPPMARPENESGRLPAAKKLQGVSVLFSRTAAEEADLEALITAQQDPTSALYHKWLTPDQFAARFGVADSDIAKVKSWLAQQGFSIAKTSRSKNRVTFSGTVEQIEMAFGTELHNYKENGITYFAPSKDIRVPAALSSVVLTVNNLSSFRPRSYVKFRPNFTSAQSGNHFLTPDDVATIYDINAAYKAGYTGSDQSIAVVGQSLIEVSDIENFQKASGLNTKDPTLVLVPDSGTGVEVLRDEAESDLDLEYTGGIATGATIYFVYVGDNSNYSVWDSISYAVDEEIAPIISVSYGSCETEVSSSDYSSLNGTLKQAASQGQSVIVASGDSGSTACYGYSDLTTEQQEALTVNFPASSQYVTALGGTEFPYADVESSNTTYWKSASGSDVVSSALSYIPEQVWNDDSDTSGLSSGGGGVSTLTARPSWQTGVTGITSGSYRLVPDISLTSSPNNAGYLYCSSDISTGIDGSCSNGFRDAGDKYLTIAGGTSFAAPVFAGMLAILNQQQNSTGQGVVNSTLYSLAADSTTYASAFHDITSGSNKCTAGSAYCSNAGASEYAAATGYDEASGLGSVDFYHLLTAWPTPLTASTTSLSAASTSPARYANDKITITVASGSSSSTTTPTGTVTIAIDGTTQSSSLTLSNGTATFDFSSTTAGSHEIKATYSGDSTYAASSDSLTITVSSAVAGFTLSATNLTVKSGSSGTSTITVTPTNGYTGTIKWTVSSSPTLTNGCAGVPNTTVSSSSAVTATMTVYTSSSSCTNSSALGSTGNDRNAGARPLASHDGIELLSFAKSAPIGIAFAGLLLVATLAYGPRKSPILAGACLMIVCGLATSCSNGSSSGSGSSSSSTSETVTTGTYTLTISGTDTSSSSITASTTMTLTVD